MYQIDFKHPIHIYFIGIGGISMSGLAEILLSEGFRISGSDMKETELTDSLEKKGAVIHYGQQTSHLTPDIDLVVYTSAIHPATPEYISMKELHLPSLSRAQLLGQMMKNYRLPVAVSGTHGKTTTTSMIAEILLENNSDPTLSIGGIFKDIGGNIRIGSSDYFVTEACEYTNSFLSFFPKIGIILNIEEDHLDFFKDIHDIRCSFRRFAELIPEDGTLIINGDIEHYEEITEGLPCRIITYGTSDACGYHCSDISYDGYAHALFTLHGPGSEESRFALAVPGEHNVSNAMAAIALADLFGIERRIAQKALLHFTGTDRRFEYKGKKNGFTIIDDYAHHPTEITATLKAAENYPHRTLWCVFQPHTYTRTKTFLHDFSKALLHADKVILTDIYAARETDTLGISSKDLQEEILQMGGECYYFPSFESIEKFISENCLKDDLLITMGAGDVVKIGENLLQK